MIAELNCGLFFIKANPTLFYKLFQSFYEGVRFPTLFLALWTFYRKDVYCTYYMTPFKKYVLINHWVPDSVRGWHIMGRRGKVLTVVLQLLITLCEPPPHWITCPSMARRCQETFESLIWKPEACKRVLALLDPAVLWLKSIQDSLATQNSCFPKQNTRPSSPTLLLNWYWDNPGGIWNRSLWGKKYSAIWNVLLYSRVCFNSYSSKIVKC